MLLSDRMQAVVGLVQPCDRIADIGCDTRLLQEAQAAADELLKRDPELLQHPATAQRV